MIGTCPKRVRLAMHVPPGAARSGSRTRTSRPSTGRATDRRAKPMVVAGTPLKAPARRSTSAVHAPVRHAPSAHRDRC
jgi:hypothetical protein